jgi:TolB protein
MMRNTSILVGLSAFLMLLIPACQTTVGPDNTVNDVYQHGRVAWSPDSKLIAFTSFVQNATGVYVMDSVGKNIHQVLDGDGVGLTWSPDGNWLAFSRGGLLYKMKPTGDSLTQVTDVSGAIRPSWSADGSKIAFVQRAPGNGIWIYDFKTGLATQFLSSGDYPSWNANSGELVVMTSGIDLNSGLSIFSFVAVNVTTNAQRALDTFYTASDCGFASVSPPGNALIFGIKRPDDFVEIWKTDLLLGVRTQLTTDGGDYPAWSPDGNRIVYTRTQTGDGGLWMMNADGSNKHRLTQP